MSHLSWTLPPSSSTTPSPGTVTAQQLLGRDVWLDVTAAVPELEVTAAGDWAMVEGREALRQSLLRRLLTSPGEWATLPDYGVGARLFVKKANTSANRDELAERIRAQFLSDRRVASVDGVVITTLPSGNGIRVQVVVTPVALGSALALTAEVA